MTPAMAQLKAQEVVQVRAREGGPQPGPCRLEGRGCGEWRRALHTEPLRLFQKGMRYAIVGLEVPLDLEVPWTWRSCALEAHLLPGGEEVKCK